MKNVGFPRMRFVMTPCREVTHNIKSFKQNDRNGNKMQNTFTLKPSSHSVCVVHVFLICQTSNLISVRYPDSVS